MAEIFNDVEAVSVTNRAQPEHVIGRVEQVRAMGRRKHQVLMSLLRVGIKGHVFSLAIELEARGRCKAKREGGLAVKLVRKLPSFEHGLRVRARGLRKSRINFQ